MTLPTQYTTTSTYFKDTLVFLNTYKWLYIIPNTHILTSNTFSNFSQEWLDYFKNISNININNIALGIKSPNMPSTLMKFIDTINSLKPTYDVTTDKVMEKTKGNVKLSKKKMHEIFNLAPVIHKKCEESGTEFIIDIGAGLGYLPQLLHEKYDYKILGIEGNPQYVQTASENNTTKSITYKHHFVTSNSHDTIKSLFQESFQCSSSICLVALHACADLSIDMLKIFKQLDIADCGVIMPCCYHRIDGTNDLFPNFPLSRELAEIYASYDQHFLTRTFLRLACQQSDATWKDMDDDTRKIQARNCLYRNLLQECAHKGSFTISRQKRKTGGNSSTYTFQEFIHNLHINYKFVYCSNEELTIEEINLIVENMDQSYSFELEKLMEIFIAMQYLIQGICENLILLDRCVYMKEFGVNCFTEKIMDDSISPRCYAFILSKRK